ncbi:hypothetical protein PHET_06565, partial [Paragonimus heterotremus]
PGYERFRAWQSGEPDENGQTAKLTATETSPKAKATSDDRLDCLMLATDWLFHHSTLSNLSPLKPLLANGPMGTLWVCLCLFSRPVERTLAGPWVDWPGASARLSKVGTDRLGGMRRSYLAVATSREFAFRLRQSPPLIYLSQKVTELRALYVPRPLSFVSCSRSAVAYFIPFLYLSVARNESESSQLHSRHLECFMLCLNTVADRHQAPKSKRRPRHVVLRTEITS